MGNKRLLFCVETTKGANTDYTYITETIRHYFVESSKIVIRPVYMESKTRYKSRAILADIQRQSGSADTSVIYCIDTDDYDTSAETKKLLDEIQKYCNEKGNDLVFFCRDVEDVFCGQQVSDTQKRQYAARFRSSQAIRNVEIRRLEKKEYQRHCSNILNVLGKYYKRKAPD